MKFILKGFQISTLQWRVGSNPRRQSKYVEMKYKARIKPVHELCDTCSQNNVKNQESTNFTPLLVVTMLYACWFLRWADYIEDFKWRLFFQFGVAFQRVVLREVYIWRAKLRSKGIEDFNLKHSHHYQVLTAMVELKSPMHGRGLWHFKPLIHSYQHDHVTGVLYNFK
jgi:hypothetical protein